MFISLGNAVLNLDQENFFYGGQQLMQGLIPGQNNKSKWLVSICLYMGHLYQPLHASPGGIMKEVGVREI